MQLDENIPLAEQHQPDKRSSEAPPFRDPFRRRSSRVERVDYQQPGVRSKLRQGDKHTFALSTSLGVEKQQQQRRRSTSFIQVHQDAEEE